MNRLVAFAAAVVITACGSGNGNRAPVDTDIMGIVQLAGPDGTGAASTNVAGVTIRLTGASTGSLTTNEFGDVRFSGLPSGNYTVTPRLEGYAFSPSSASVTFTGPEVRVSFMAHAASRVRWIFSTGGTLRPGGAPIYYSSPAIAPDGTIYVANGAPFQQMNLEQGLYAINPDGSRKWYFAGPEGTGHADGTGFLSSPVLGPDGTIYAQDDKGWVYAVRSDGTLKWRFQTPFGSWPVGSPTPAVGADGTIYAGAADVPFALNSDGTVRWRGGYALYQMFWSAPAIAPDGTIYFGGSGLVCDGVPRACANGGFLRAMNPDGTTRWTYPMMWTDRMDGASNTFSSPAIGSDGTIYLGAETATTGFVYAVNRDGTLKWRHETSNTVRSSPSIGPDGSIYIGTKSFLGTRTATSADAELLALNPDGTLKWKYVVDTAGADIYCSPTVGADGMIYFGAEDGFLHSLNPDGTLAWKYAIGGINWTSPALTGDGTLYIAGNDGNLFALVTTSRGLASSPWPKKHHDNGNSGKF